LLRHERMRIRAFLYQISQKRISFLAVRANPNLGCSRYDRIE
jgi:hypothetical protein